MSLDDRAKAAFEAAGDMIKQILTLATGSIGGAIALFDDDHRDGVQFGAGAGWVDAGLVLLALSVGFGLLAMGAKAGQLGADAITKPSTYSGAMRYSILLQMVLFGLGIGALVVAATG